MDATDWLAGLSGGLTEVTKAKHEDEDRNLEREKMRSNEKIADVRAEVQRMLGTIRADTSTGNNTRTNSTRQDIAGMTEGGRNTRAGMRDTTTRRGQDIRSSDTQRGQDLGDAHYQDSAARMWDSLYMNDATRRRGQDISSADSRYGVDTRDEQSGDALRARNALGILGLRARRRPSLLSDAPPEDFANEFDQLYNNPDQAGSEALAATAPGQDVQNPPAAAAPANRPQVPVSPRRAPAAAPPAGGADAGAGGALEGQARQLIQAIKTKEAAGGDATAERAQLAALRAQVK